MATNINLTLTGLTESPLVSDAPAVTLNNLANLFQALAGHEVNGTVALLTTPSAVQATGTVTFSGAATAADTVTIAGTALTATKKNATGTITCASVANNDTVTIQGVVFTAKTSPSATVPTQWARGGTNTADAAALVACVNAYAPTNALVTATNSAGVVTLRAVTAGTAANSYTLASSDGATLAVSGATLAGGAAAGNNAWDPGNTATTAAVAFTAAVNASSTAAVSGNVSATSALGVVTLTARAPGQGGNVTLTKSGSNIAVSGALLTGGALGTTTTISF